MDPRADAAIRSAAVIRKISVPPVMAALLVAVLAAFRRNVVSTWSDLLLSLLFLSLLPAAAYPLSELIPSVRRRGREGQRDLAFVLSLASYTAAWCLGILGGMSGGLAMICTVYFFSVLILLLFNKALGLRASGHACSVTGPIIMACVYFGGWGALAGLPLYAAIFWASLHSGRHTAKELLLGTAACEAAYLLALGFCRLTGII
ncbi:MAG: hypothetical protein IKE57_05620 [Oscillospiraceae bacterium]|nr:hypothetical protein [Oscillospiraceae bacterium]